MLQERSPCSQPWQAYWHVTRGRLLCSTVTIKTHTTDNISISVLPVTPDWLYRCATCECLQVNSTYSCNYKGSAVRRIITSFTVRVWYWDTHGDLPMGHHGNGWIKGRASIGWYQCSKNEGVSNDHINVERPDKQSDQRQIIPDV